MPVDDQQKTVNTQAQEYIVTQHHTNIPDRVERLQGILTEHHRQICPHLTCQPAIKKRKAVPEP